MNRTVKDAPTRAFHYDTAGSLRAHVLALSACNAWKANPSVFKINPHHLVPGAYS